MKSPSIHSVLFIAVLLAPLLRAQDAPAKIHEIERKVMLEKYRTAVRALIQSAQEFESGGAGRTPDLVDKRAQWLVLMDGKVEGEDKVAALDREEMVQSATALNELAWHMITSRNAGDRHPDIALKLVDIALELVAGDGNLKSQMLDTRARALFLLGRREEAIAAQEKAFAGAVDAIEKVGFETTLAAYRSNQLPEIAPLAGGNLAKGQIEATGGVTQILKKMKGIVIPSIQFENATLEEAVDFLRKKSVELDTSETDPALKGVNIVVSPAIGRAASGPGKETGQPEIIRIKELKLRNVPLAEALRFICDGTQLRYKVDDFAVTLVSPKAPEDLYNRNFTVPPGFGGSQVPIQDFLRTSGIQFGEGASVFLTSDNQLVVRNTPTELDKIEALVVTDIHARSNRTTTSPPAGETPAPVTPSGR